MGNTQIEYAAKVWNPVTGCTPISAGCDNCWAQAYLHRWKKPLGVTLHPKRLNEPHEWREPQIVFVASMGDLFHEDVPIIMVEQVMSIIRVVDHHQYLILTKRPDRMLSHLRTFSKLPYNLWLGVSVEDDSQRHRIETLLQIQAAHHWVSLEPMLGVVDFGDILHGSPTKDSEDGEWYQTHPPPDWVVVGCESGARRRPCKIEWVESVIDDCVQANVPLFIKQLPDLTGKHIIKMPKIRGKVWAETPWRKQ